MEQEHKQKLQRLIVKALCESKEQEQEGRLKNFYRSIWEKHPIKDLLIGLLFLTVFCVLFFVIVGVPVIYFSSHYKIIYTP